MEGGVIKICFIKIDLSDKKVHFKGNNRNQIKNNFNVK